MFLAIVNTQNERVTKFAEYATQAEAEAHSVLYGGIVFDNASDWSIRDLRVVGDVVSHDPVIDKTPAEIDMENLNKELALDGSIVRALGEVMRQEINKLRKHLGLSEYTGEQFKDALRNKMRD